MRKLFCALAALAVTGCTQVDQDTYKRQGGGYSRSDGWFQDSSHNWYLMTNATSVADVDASGNAEFNSVTADYPTLLYQQIRFCGNGNDGSTAHYMGPVPYDDTEADLMTGGAGCDALDDATIGNVDAAWPISPNLAFYPVSMVCSGICTGASAANDTITLTLYDDTVAVSDMACSFTFAGDATANQCTVTDESPTLVAAGSLLAIGVAGTDDVCDDAGDDFECYLYVTF